MRFIFHVNGELIDVYYKSSKETVDLGTLSFSDSDKDYRPEIRELLLIALGTDNPMIVIEKVSG